MHPLEDLGVATKAGAEQRTMMEQPPIEQLGSSPADMSNLLSGTKIAAIVLDKDLRVRRYAAMPAGGASWDTGDHRGPGDRSGGRRSSRDGGPARLVGVLRRADPRT